MKKLNYLKAITICHGKSEVQMCEFIRSNLKIKIAVESDKKGKKSIQITSLNKFLKNAIFINKSGFLNKYGEDLPDRKIPKDFKIFIIMDLDDCTKEQKRKYINKAMFKNHWLYDYIIPVFNDPELESVLIKSKIKYEHSKGKMEQYIKIFPTDKKYIKSDSLQIEEFKNKLITNKDTNMHELVSFCLNIAD